MMVTFVSQCEKSAIKRTRRVLDSFAERIGDNTWQTVITQEGLNAVNKLLRKTASKNTAVCCHWIRSRARSDRVWVVGNKRKFNENGVVPVNSTKKNDSYRDDRADWHYLPLIQSLASLSALLHDWGKANARFQQKLQKSYKGTHADALRHEWVSCLLLKALISTTANTSDRGWLKVLAEGKFNEDQLSQIELRRLEKPLSGLPLTAQLVAWLIVTHHRMPLQRKASNKLLNDWKGVPASSMKELLDHIEQDWGYWNESAKDTFEACLSFPHGLVMNSKLWLKGIRRWAKKLLDQQTQISSLLTNGSYRLILHHARLCLMLGDHYYSSLSTIESGFWQKNSELIANTQRDGMPKQALDQHLVGVYERAKHNAQKLPFLERELPVTDNIMALRKKSPYPFQWQDKAAKRISAWTSQHRDEKSGFFAVNMASTGLGKTFANAKVMLALSENNDSLRYILALGLRTLTLQTGDEYRERIFQNTDGSDLAVLIGSKSIADLHSQERIPEVSSVLEEERGSESQESLFGAEEEIFYDLEIMEDGLDTILPDSRARKFLYAPILACTIDHIMAATETTRGGRYILPCLRLMSSDLVVDEIDDFTDSDAIAIGRLIHLAGMLGRKVMISSATIPPALAEGYFNCYYEGWQQFANTRTAISNIGCAWIDEFNTEVADIEGTSVDKTIQKYAQSHDNFIKKRVAELSQQAAKRKAEIIDCQTVVELQNNDTETKKSAYFSVIAKSALSKHQVHHQTDSITGLKVSFGLVRMANIGPCIELTRYLLDYGCPEEFDLRVMPYHSQQVLLLRHEQERHLDLVLKRKEASGEQPAAFRNSVIRQHLDCIAIRDLQPRHVLFILVATPVEEVGRDHDFDWAIVEPSSYRSIVQLAGRVRRHRTGETLTPNLGLLQFNWLTIERGDEPLKPRFFWPGYESNNRSNDGKTFSFKTHDLKHLLDENELIKKLDASPRIHNTPDTPRFAALEHAVIASQLTNYHGEGPDTLQGYLTGHWYLTALPQALHRFRSSEANIHLYRYMDEKTPFCFLEKNENGKPMVDDVYQDPVDRSAIHHIAMYPLNAEQQQRLWLVRDFYRLLKRQTERTGTSLVSNALRFGELLIREPRELELDTQYYYNDQLGLFKRLGDK